MKPNLLILGYARHGKDYFADLVCKAYGPGLKFTSSSLFACERAVLPVLGPRYGYKSVQEAYDDRGNHRAEWHDLIAEYNRQDPARLAHEMLAEGNRVYVGMRSITEYEACLNERLFCDVVWVHRPGTPDEPAASCPLRRDDALRVWRQHCRWGLGWTGVVNPGPLGTPPQQAGFVQWAAHVAHGLKRVEERNKT